jgi:hypothetical protein
LDWAALAKLKDFHTKPDRASQTGWRSKGHPDCIGQKSPSCRLMCGENSHAKRDGHMKGNDDVVYFDKQLCDGCAADNEGHQPQHEHGSG